MQLFKQGHENQAVCGRGVSSMIIALQEALLSFLWRP